MSARIYKIINDINNKEYVGQTYKTLEERFDQHYKCSRWNLKTMPIVLAIKKYGIEHFKILLLEELLENLPQNEVDDKEIEWGLKLNTLSPNGYNLRLGFSKGILSNEVKLKIGDIHRGKTVSQETRNKISKANTGRIRPQFEKDKISKNNPKIWLGKKRSEEDKLKMSKPKTFSEGISPLSKKVIAECNGNTYVFSSMADAVRSNIFDKPIFDISISKCCRGILKSCGKINGIKVRWSYVKKIQKNYAF